MFGKDLGLIPNANTRGWKIAKVVSNEDPKGQERVLIRVLGVHNLNNTDIDNAIWAYHCAPNRSGSGDLPVAGDWIWGQFISPSDFMTFLWFGFVRSSFQDGQDAETKPPDAIFDLFGDVELEDDEI